MRSREASIRDQAPQGSLRWRRRPRECVYPCPIELSCARRHGRCIIYILLLPAGLLFYRYAFNEL
jgi:hypothetical protein